LRQIEEEAAAKVAKSVAAKEAKAATKAVQDATQPAVSPLPASDLAATGEVSSRVPLPQQVLDLFKPRAKFGASSREKTLSLLDGTAEGSRLKKLITKFQSESARSIPRLRSDIEKVLTGAGDTLPVGRRADIETLLSAVGQTPVENKVLHRGMSIPGRIDDVLARYKSGDDMDITLGSFTSDRYVAQRFASGQTYGQAVKASSRKVAVRVEWLGEGKRALPIQNTAYNDTIFAEKEFLASGKFTITEVKRIGDEVVIRVQQKALW
ncbi:MAG: hypothetical protein M3445_04315, partial [Actinomycetota bacterium]|nr:hypothetical protein [Actinomycetota bacterium]